MVGAEFVSITQLCQKQMITPWCRCTALTLNVSREKQLESEHEARLRAETAAESTGLQVSGLKDDVKRLEKEVGSML